MSTVVEHVTCTFCGCLCDDLTVEAEGTEIRKVRRACSSGLGIFMDYDPRPRRPLVDGREVEWDEAVAEAAAILSASDSPLIYGLSSSASATALRCASRPRPDLPCLSVLTRR